MSAPFTTKEVLYWGTFGQPFSCVLFDDHIQVLVKKNHPLPSTCRGVMHEEMDLVDKEMELADKENMAGILDEDEAEEEVEHMR